MDSPLGQLLLTAREEKLSGLYFVDQSNAPLVKDCVRQDDAPIFALVQEQMEQFIAGNRECFELPMALSGTPFQLDVWNEIARVPFGQTISYSELAWRIGRATKDARAIGAATGLNPIGLIIPCHRVIGKSGDLTGYAGGLARKRALLKFESYRAAGREMVLEMTEAEPELALA